MSTDAKTPLRRKRGTSTSADADVKAEQETTELTRLELINVYVFQYIGSVICVIGVALLIAGYDREWMHNTHLCLLSLGICLVGWFFHEIRPFNAQKVYQEQLEARKAE